MLAGQIVVIATLALMVSCKNAAQSTLSDAATTSSYKTGAFLPKLPKDYGFRGTAKKKTVDQLLAALDKKRLDGVKYFTTVSAQGEHFLIAYPNAAVARKSYPIIVGSIDKSGKRYSYMAYVAMGSEDFKITDTFVKQEVGAVKDLTPEIMYVMRQPKSEQGIVEPMLVPWLRHVKSETSEYSLYRVGNTIISTEDDNVAFSYDEIGNQVWRVRGIYEDKDLVAGALVWSKDLVTYYSIRPDDKAVTLWKKQDNDSMDRVKRLAAGASDYPKIPSIVTRNLKPSLAVMNSDQKNPVFRGVDACAGDVGVIQMHRACGDLPAGSGFGLVDDTANLSDDDFFEYAGNRSGDKKAFGLDDPRVKLGSTTTYNDRTWLGGWRRSIDNWGGRMIDSYAPQAVIDANDYLRSTTVVKGAKAAVLDGQDTVDEAVVATFRGKRPDGATDSTSYYNPATRKVEIETTPRAVDNPVNPFAAAGPTVTRTVEPDAYMRSLQSATSAESMERLEVLDARNSQVRDIQGQLFDSGESLAKTHETKIYSGTIVTDAVIDGTVGAATDRLMPKGTFGDGPAGAMKEAWAKGGVSAGKKFVKDSVSANMTDTPQSVSPMDASGRNWLYDMGQEATSGAASQYMFGSSQGSSGVKFAGDAAQRYANGQLPVTPGSVFKAGGDFLSDTGFKYFGPGTGDALSSVTKNGIITPSAAIADFGTMQGLGVINGQNEVEAQNLRTSSQTAPLIQNNLQQAMSADYGSPSGGASAPASGPVFDEPAPPAADAGGSPGYGEIDGSIGPPEGP